ncbi:MAG: hypothetical protein LZF60_50098 [Nitrospira sp.]|nr:hypothetical protein [Nitrospira sp.]ULA58365.1 MAG: hypothetical protein LZF60_50098 [Nitrospira sp.]
MIGTGTLIVSRRIVLATGLLLLAIAGQEFYPPGLSAAEHRSHLDRAAVFLRAGDYRQALEACQAEVKDAPSARSYVYLTYAYHALDGYLQHLASTDQWVRVEQLYVNLSTGRVEDLLDPPDVLARIAKEVIQQAVQRQADVTAALAARLDEPLVKQLWQEQTAWRQARPDDWWSGAPPQWQWGRP